VKLSIYQIDAFADALFAGNPAAVIPLDAWLPDEVMQAIAAENALSETAFFVPEDEGFRLRWFTPTVEVPLCGHATLASAYVLFKHLDFAGETIFFETLSGPLRVHRGGDGLLTLDFPAHPAPPMPVPADVAAAVGAEPVGALAGRSPVLVFETAEEVLDLAPDLPALARTSIARGEPGVIVTAPGPAGSDVDFVSRCFFPAEGIDEDPVTGSAHTVLVPWWAGRLGKTELVARQASARGGTLWCRLAGERVEISGRCVDYLRGEISLP
jgi:PhzF family phenazine biosynthesis protein